jgi:hypothetical protein
MFTSFDTVIHASASCETACGVYVKHMSLSARHQLRGEIQGSVLGDIVAWTN